MHLVLSHRLAAVALVVLLALWNVPHAQAQTPCADLTITNLTVTPSSPVQGQNATISVTVRNNGTCAAQAFVVQWRTDLFAQTGPSVSIASLAANTSTTVNLVFAFPQAGNFLTSVVVDTGNSVNETNESNNFQILSVTVQQAVVNLSVTGFDVAPLVPLLPGENQADAVQGEVARATITVVNEGNSPAGSFLVAWHPWLFAPPVTQQVNGLGIGATATLTLDHNYQLFATTTQTVDSWVTVDSASQVIETDEFDNTAALEVTVDPNLPDLVIDGVSQSPNPAVAGSPVTISITIRNRGHEPAGPFRVEWQTSTFFGQTLSTQVNSLGIGQSTVVTFNYTYSGLDALFGQIISQTRLDSASQVFEFDENNNVTQTTIFVGQSFVDLEITSLTITPPSPTQGTQATAHITIRNNGNTTAGPFIVEWNPDTFPNTVFTQGPLTVSQQVNGLGAGATTTVNLNFTYPRSGNFHTVAKVDAFNQIAETVETNNNRILDITVLPAAIDLVITNFTISPTQPVQFSEATASITVRNQGTFPAGGFFVQWKLKDTDAFGALAFVNGLNVGEQQTVTLDGIYFETGTFTSVAGVDVFNSVVEPGPGAETNNTSTRSVTVVQPQTTLRVTLNSVRVINDLDGADPDDDKNIDFGVADPSQSCTINLPFANQTVPGIRCIHFEREIGDNETETINGSIDITLEGLFTPLIAGVSMLDQDVVPPDEYMGAALYVAFPPFTSGGPFTVEGQGCEESGGHCFDANISIQVLSTNVPASTLSRTGVQSATLNTLEGALQTSIKETLTSGQQSGGANPR